jgi:succinate dehydrogenase / fumarate reductase membrane anchor subunit
MSMTEKTASMRTPLSRVRNLGSAKAGTSDFFRQRLTAIGLVLLIVPMVIIIMTMLGRNYAATAQILGSPIIDIVMILFVIASVLHMKIGMQVILEDYVHSEKLKLAAIIANNFFSLAVGLASIYAILKLSSGV